MDRAADAAWRRGDLPRARALFTALTALALLASAAQAQTSVANAWVREFIGASMDREYASTADARKFLEDRLAMLKTKLEQSEHDAATFASANSIIALETSRSVDGKPSTTRVVPVPDTAETVNVSIQSKAV